MSDVLDFEATLWQWDARQSDSWFFVTLPSAAAPEIADRTQGRRGFGSVKVRATIGATTWSTSIFPDKNSGSYVLPVKKPVRLKEQIDGDDTVRVILELLE